MEGKALKAEVSLSKRSFERGEDYPGEGLMLCKAKVSREGCGLLGCFVVWDFTRFRVGEVT